jgi:hypothetical protein
MKSIYFLINNDQNHENIIHSGSGASEFLFYLTAKKLSEFLNVIIINRFSSIPVKIDNIQYLFLPDNKNINIYDSVIIVQRNFDTLIYLHKTNQSNRYILWCHDYIEDTNHLFGDYTVSFINQYFHQNNIHIIAVSNFHKENIASKMPDIKIFPIYNALFSEYFKRDEKISYDKDSIIFASSWSKGIDNILMIGKKYYSKNNNFKLKLIKPVYCEWIPYLSNYPFIEIIGTIKDKNEYCRLLQQNLCLLSTSFPETFGCVFTESLHLGVPVIGDKNTKCGFHEIIPEDHMCNFNDIDEVIKKIEEFREHRPTVILNEKFKDYMVINEWLNIL